MNLEELLTQFGGRSLDIESLSPFWQQSLALFTNPSIVSHPYISTTLQYDVTEFEKSYQNLEAHKSARATFSAYISYCLLKAIHATESLRWRFIENQWYTFDNLPAFFPVATQTQARYGSALVCDSAISDWYSFARNYMQTVEDARSGKTSSFMGPELFLLSTSISIVPHLRFSSMTHHVSATQSTRIAFVLGKRYSENGRLFMPLMLHAHHANCDGLVIASFFEALEKQITAIPLMPVIPAPQLLHG